MFSTQIVAVRDDVLGAYTTSKYLIRFNADGSFIDQSPFLGHEIYQFAHNGDDLIVATAEFEHTTPTTYRNGKIQRVSRTAIGSIAATYTASSPDDIRGVAHDGTNPWITEYVSGNLRKLDPTTLASVSSYALNAGITAVQYLSGDLWVVSSTTDEVVQWDIVGTSETQRFSVVNSPYDLILANGLAFVLGSGGLGVYDQSDGSLVATHTLSGASLLPQRSMCLFDGYVAVVDVLTSPYTIVLIDATTGAFVRRLSTGHSYLFFASGTDGASLFATVGGPGESAQTISYELRSGDLAGYTVRVFQNSASVGRGYPAEITL